MSAPSDSAAASPRRRTLLTTTAVVAAGVGAGVAWRLHGGRPAAVHDDAAAVLWSQPFDTPEGAPLDVATLRGQQRLLVNFWATWCPPCVAELPLVDAFGRDQAGRGWRVLGLAVDQPSSVRKFLAARPVAFPVGMAGLQGTELSRQLGNAEGGLPFTVVFDGNGAVLHRKIGQLSPALLAQWATATA